MSWFFVVLIVLALGGVAVVAAGLGAPMTREYDDRPDSLLPADGAVRGDDLRRVRFSVVTRGYRMAEVDALLERLALQCDAQIEAGSCGEAGPCPDVVRGDSENPSA